MSSLNSHPAPLRSDYVQAQAATPPITRELPFGITTIVGGTNLRFSLSSPLLQSPCDTAISWQELLRPGVELSRDGKLEELRTLAFKEIGRRFVSFIETHSAPDPKGPPFSKLHTIIFSVAGIVNGDRVSLTNVPLGIVQKDLAQEILLAINEELGRRGFEHCSPKTVAVVNDAVAGLMGELRAGGLYRVQNGAFIILGTGMGGIVCTGGAPYTNLDELGHRFLVRSSDHTVRILAGDTIAPYLSGQGEFAAVHAEESYAEHHLAGPWAAARFVKTVSERGEVYAEALSQRLSEHEGFSEARIRSGLQELGTLPWDELHLWGQRAPSDIVRCVNQLLFSPSVSEVVTTIRRAKSCSQNPHDVVTELSYHTWRGYFELLGRCGAALRQTLHSTGTPLERIVLGGGIGEACNHYPEIWKRHAYSIMRSRSGLPPGAMVFSPMRAEERENALTAASINEATTSCATVYH